MSRTKKSKPGSGKIPKSAPSAQAMDIDTDPGHKSAAAAHSSAAAAHTAAAAAHTAAILHSKHSGNAGISKSVGGAPKKSKPLKHAQRVRRAKGQERATAVAEQLAQKVGESKGRGRKVRERRRDWADVNDGAVTAAVDGAGAMAIEDKGGKETRKRNRKAAKRARIAELQARPTDSNTDGPAGGVDDSMLEASFVTAREGPASDHDDDEDEDIL